MAPFFTGLLACIWLGEKLPMFQIIAMVCCFIGIVVVVTAPPAATDVTTDTGFEEETESQPSTSHLGVVLCFIAMLFMSI